MPRKVSWFR
ncbi:hypothetical protein VCHC41A1_1931, partial [Vibrio cholerae HC-41A1]